MTKYEAKIIRNLLVWNTSVHCNSPKDVDRVYATIAQLDCVVMLDAKDRSDDFGTYHVEISVKD